MTKEEAQAAFRALIQQYGIKWTAKVPREAWDLLHEINKVLDVDGRREALGRPPRKPQGP